MNYLNLVFILALAAGYLEEISAEIGCHVPKTPHIVVMVDNERVNSTTLIEAGTAVAISCEPGFILTGGSDVALNTFCLRSGRFLAKFGRCVPVCKDVPKIEHGVMGNSQVDSDGRQTRQVRCERGYRIISGNSSIECSEETGFQWTAPGNCMRVCGRVPDLENGLIMTVNGTHRYAGAYRQAICDDGFVLVGSPGVICGEDGQWNVKASCMTVANAIGLRRATLSKLDTIRLRKRLNPMEILLFIPKISDSNNNETENATTLK